MTRRPTGNTAVGQRMRAAAAQARLTATAIAKQMGVSVPTVTRWWSGERDPSTQQMLTYARLVGQSVGSFYGEDGEAEGSEALLDSLLQWAGRLMDGEEPGVAFERVTGEAHGLTPREQRELARA